MPRYTFGMNQETPLQFHSPNQSVEQVCFDRKELNLILTLYGRMVAAAEWRDYAISIQQDYAAFAIYRRTAEYPLYQIEKRPKLRSKQGMFAVLGADGRVLKRGHDLAPLLRLLEKPLLRSVD